MDRCITASPKLIKWIIHYCLHYAYCQQLNKNTLNRCAIFTSNSFSFLLLILYLCIFLIPENIIMALPFFVQWTYIHVYIFIYMLICKRWQEKANRIYNSIFINTYICIYIYIYKRWQEKFIQCRYEGFIFANYKFWNIYKYVCVCLRNQHAHWSTFTEEL